MWNYIERNINELEVLKDTKNESVVHYLHSFLLTIFAISMYCYDSDHDITDADDTLKTTLVLIQVILIKNFCNQVM